MCGIAGIFRPDGVVERSDLEAMGRALRHRGPDASGLWFEGPIGLAHTRLSIVDLSERGAQPMASADDRWRITFNGEIYNHRRLRADLEAEGVRLRGTSDTEVLLEGLARHGEAYLDRVEGMFAFALYDRERQRLLLARDRAGEKPLFYLPLPRGGVAFASEVKALRAVASLDVSPDPTAIAPFLVYGYAPCPRTFYRGVWQLPPAHLAVFDPAAPPAAPRRYWAPSFAPRRDMPIAEARAELRERMKVIVRDRLDADVPVGAFLSGGLDSATVVGVATRDLGRTVHTYSIGFADKTMDESDDARLSARHLGSIHQEFIVSEADLPSVEMLVAHHDGPFGDSSALPTYLVSKLAREHVTVAVTGDGGDEVFGGYPRFLGAQLGELVPSWAGSAGRHLVGGLRRLGLGGDPSGRTHLARAGRFAAAIERPLEHKLLHWTSYFAPDLVPGLLRPELAAAASGLTRPSDLVFGETVGQSTLARTLHHNFQTYLPDDLLVKVDRCSMAVSLETRSPLLDSGLIDFVGSLPDSYKTRGLTTKRLLRETFADLLAPDLLRRPKRGFGVPLWTWFDGSLRPLLDDTLRSADARLYRYLDRDRVHALLWPTPRLDAPRAGQAWCLVTLELWLRQVGL